MLDFRTKYDPIVVYTNPGSPIDTVYDREVTKTGAIKVVKKDTKNIYEEIQSSADSVNINTILKKFLKTGDPSVLQQVPAMFADLTNAPVDKFEMFNQIQNGKNLFNQLSADIRAEFDNDYVKFISQAGSDEWFKKLQVKDVNKDNKVDVKDLNAMATKKEGESNE